MKTKEKKEQEKIDWKQALEKLKEGIVELEKEEEKYKKPITLDGGIKESI